jgi:hypothetical protein
MKIIVTNKLFKFIRNKIVAEGLHTQPNSVFLYMKEVFGLERTDAKTYKIVDNSKFTIFQLMHPEMIHTIYE